MVSSRASAHFSSRPRWGSGKEACEPIALALAKLRHETGASSVLTATARSGVPNDSAKAVGPGGGSIPPTPPPASVGHPWPPEGCGCKCSKLPGQRACWERKALVTAGIGLFAIDWLVGYVIDIG
jgi:hypothetical protein